MFWKRRLMSLVDDEHFLFGTDPPDTGFDHARFEHFLQSVHFNQQGSHEFLAGGLVAQELDVLFSHPSYPIFPAFLPIG